MHTVYMCLHNNACILVLYLCESVIYISSKVWFCVSLVDFISSCYILCCTVSQLYHQSARAVQCIQPLSNHCSQEATTASGHSVMKKHGSKTKDHVNVTLRTNKRKISWHAVLLYNFSWPKSLDSLIFCENWSWISFKSIWMCCLLDLFLSLVHTLPEAEWALNHYTRSGGWLVVSLQKIKLFP